MGSTQIPFIVAGTGGYFNLSGFKKTSSGVPPELPFIGTDAKGNMLRLDAFKENSFGFMRMSVSASAVTGEFLGVNLTTKAVTMLDQFTLDLTAHRELKASVSQLSLPSDCFTPGSHVWAKSIVRP
jgi:hypothetical protein